MKLKKLLLLLKLCPQNAHVRRHHFHLLISLMALICASSLHAEEASQQIIAAARDQIGKTIRYDPAYIGLDYPAGDIPIESGVCTDVVIRALRAGIQADLQQLVHEDMRQHFSSYPKIWGLKRPDPNIDHRRVPNLMTFFKRRGYALPHTPKLNNVEPGDLITCLVPPRLPHIMIVSDQRGPSGHYQIIHNIGSGTVEEDRLHDFKITGHFRWKP